MTFLILEKYRCFREFLNFCGLSSYSKVFNLHVSIKSTLKLLDFIAKNVNYDV